MYAQVLFNRDPVFALPDQGTKSNPVLVSHVREGSEVAGFMH